MSKLNEKDRQLIVARELGKRACTAFPALDTFLDAVSTDADVKYLLTGSLIKAGLDKLITNKVKKKAKLS